MAGISKKTFLSPRNLGKPLFYCPIMKEALPLLGLMRYPSWSDSICDYAAKQVYFSFKRRSDVFYATGEDGSLLFIGIELDLTKLASLIRVLRSRQNITVALLCLDWQKQFYSDILECFAGDSASNVRVLSMNNDAVLNMGVQLGEYWSENTKLIYASYCHLKQIYMLHLS